MDAMEVKPSFSQLYEFISKIADYPVSVRQLIKKARDTGAAKEIIEFYGRFADDQVFKTKAELKGRSEQVGMMRAEGYKLPPEDLAVPQED